VRIISLETALVRRNASFDRGDDMRRLLTWLAPLLLLLGAGAGQAELASYQPPPPPPPPPAADGAGNWSIPMIAEAAAPAGIDRDCTPDRRLCVSLRSAAGWSLEVTESGGAARVVAASPAAGAGTYYGLFGPVFAEASGAWLIGIEQGLNIDGGKGWHSVSTLSLFRLAPGAAGAHPVLDVPLSATHSIHLCADPRDRRGHQPLPPGCTRDYRLESIFMMDRENRAGPPRFILQSRAGVFMGPHAHVPGPGVTAAMMGEDDPICTYRRVFTFDPATGRYRPDAPLPACRDYLTAGE
jgi:hypothetical protein